MADVVVTGAAGFVASHLVDFHLDRGDTVIGLDNLSTGSLSNIAHLRDEARFTFVEADVTQPLPPLPARVQHVYHMASPASPPRYMELARETLLVNSVGTMNMLDYSVSAGARMLYASTSEVYGDPEVHPQVESYWGNVNPVGARSVYDEAKRFGEAMVSHYRRDRGADTVLVRIFNTYGPRMDPFDGRVVSTFIRQMLAGEPISMFGDGSQTRSFCYVSDLVRGLYAAMTSNIPGPVNLGNPTELTLGQLVSVAAEILGVEPVVEYSSLPEDDPKRRQPDITLARRDLGWEPEVALEAGLRTTAEWIRASLTA